MQQYITQLAGTYYQCNILIERFKS